METFYLKVRNQWSESNLVTLPTDGDLGITSNYIGIALSSVAAKITNRLILNRIRPPIDKLLRPNQNGYRPGRSTVAHILALRRLIKGVKSKNLKAVVVFVDFKKAFDSVHRGKMMKISQAYDITDKLVNAINENTRARVGTPDGETALFDILAGVLQGDTLAPFLIATVLYYAMRMTIGGREEQLGFHLKKRRSRRHPPVIVTDTDFADHIALVTEEIAQAQIMLSEVESKKLGLHKTEVMLFNQDDEIPIKPNNGKQLKTVNNFKYLGG